MDTHDDIEHQITDLEGRLTALDRERKTVLDALEQLRRRRATE